MSSRSLLITFKTKSYQKIKSNINSTHSGYESVPHEHRNRLNDIVTLTRPVLEACFISHATQSTSTVTMTACLGFLDCYKSGNPGQITKSDCLEKGKSRVNNPNDSLSRGAVAVA